VTRCFLSILLGLAFGGWLLQAAPPGDPNMKFPVPTTAQLDAIAAMLPAKPVGVGRPIIRVASKLKSNGASF